jgi:diguanylate cyclase (GGDEF)-like protein
MPEQSDFLGLLLDCLDDQIAVLNADGGIVYVNQSWVRFGEGNGLPVMHRWLGTNYLGVCSTSADCGDVGARQAYEGIQRVLRGELDHFHYEYPCHSPSERRWFLMRMVPLRGMAQPYFVVSHVNITERKLIEEQVEAQSLTDPLTGLANRRRFDLFLHDEWLRSLREQSPISLVMLDLDHFKAFNDTFGHVAGDAYLRQVGDILRHHARRPTDLAARYGGEEFALVLGNTDQTGAEMAAEAVRADIAGLARQRAEGVVATSASAGVICTVPQQGEPEVCLVDGADQALYQAKRLGRNRVVLSPCPLPPALRTGHCSDHSCACGVQG